MFGSFGWMELLLILFIVLIIFGAGKIPQLGEGLGKAIKGFKKSIHEPDESATAEPPSESAQLPQQGEQMLHGTPAENQNESSVKANPQHNISQPTEHVHKS